MTGAPDVPTFAEKGYPFYWEQMRGSSARPAWRPKRSPGGRTP
jgi:tripartite-type tricarboxylate transporter receptor subunit TctC